MLVHANGPNLKSDISTFEEAFQKLLETLKYFEAHGQIPVHPPLERCGTQVADEQNAKVADVDVEIEIATPTAVGLECHDDEARLSLSSKASFTFELSSTCDMNPTSPPGSSIMRNSSSLGAPIRALKLDKSWADMHRAYEEVADARLDDYLAPEADRQSVRSNTSLFPQNKPKTRLPVVHPHSNAKILWDFFGCVLLACDLVTIPIMLAWDLEMRGILVLLFYFSLVYWPFDLLVCFNTAYYIKGIIVEDRLMICLHYCRGWLLFDLLLISSDFFMSSLPRETSLRTLKVLRFVRILRLMRIMKLSKASSTVTAAFNAKGTQEMSVLLSLIKIVSVNVLFTAHVMACAWFYIGHESMKNNRAAWIVEAAVVDVDGSSQYLFSLHWIMAQITPAPMNIQPQNAQERFFTVCVILFSLFVFGGTLAKMRGVLDSLAKKNSEKSEKQAQLAQYLKNCHASVELSARVFRYARYQLSQSGKGAEPPPGLIPKALMDELLLHPRKPTLIQHPLFQLFDVPFAHYTAIITKMCSEGLVGQWYGSSENVFVDGTLAQWLLLAKAGRYEIQGKEEEPPLSAPCWFAEVCLFAKHIHSSTLSTTSVGECFTLSRTDLIRCVESSPIVNVSVVQYARTFLAHVSINYFSCFGVVPDYLPRSFSEDACCGTHLHVLHGNLRTPGKRDWEESRRTTCSSLVCKVSNARNFIEHAFQKTIMAEQLGDQIKKAFPELDNGGAFEVLEHTTECRCVIAAISSAVLLMNDQYDTFVRSQDGGGRLTLEQWSEFQSFVRWADIDAKTAHAMFIFLLLRGLVKSKRVAGLCAPKCRATREQMLIHCLTEKDFGKMLPSIVLLDHEQIQLIKRVCDLYETFNMPQFLQGENLPHSLAMLLRQDRFGDVFKPYVFSQVCMMCGLSGKEQEIGSSFMTSSKAVPVLLGVLHLREIKSRGAVQTYFSYIFTRAAHVGLQGSDREALAFARLICLSRIVDEEGLKPLQDAWNDQSANEKRVLTDHFLNDGIKDFAILILFLPLYLSKALDNQMVGTSRALRMLVEILQFLYAGTFAGTSSLTLTVDIESFAEFTGAVPSSEAFEDCFHYIRLRKAGEIFVVVIDDEQGAEDFGEQVTKIHRKVKQIFERQAKADAFLSNIVGNQIEDERQEDGIDKRKSWALISTREIVV